MDLIAIVLNVFLNLDNNLAWLVTSWGFWIYPFLFGIIFLETGIVLAPFLPGDSLIFVAGTLAGIGHLNVWLLFLILTSAAIIGDSVNYSIGKFIGPKIFTSKSKFFKEKYLFRAKAFYDKKGGIAIFLARFIPIVRTFIPFVAGITKMDYRKFLYWNAIGGLIWVSVNLFTGYFLGNMQWVKDNFNLVLIIVMLGSMLPIVIDFIQEYIRSKKLKNLKPNTHN